MKINRPLSPHLTIYKPQLTSTFSIFHRISGAFLGVAVRLLVITIKALLPEGLRAYPIAEKGEHATSDKGDIRRLSASFSAYSRILRESAGACQMKSIYKYIYRFHLA